MLTRLLQHQDAPPLPSRSLSSDDLALCGAESGADVAFIEACRRVFDAIDADRGGSLSAVELREALERLSVLGPTGEGPSEADADAMLSAADADADGEIDFSEFVAIVLSGGGSDGGSGWWASFLQILSGSAGSGDEGGGSAQPELVRLESEADVEKLIARFTPAFRAALDALFDRLAAAGEEDFEAAVAAAAVDKDGGVTDEMVISEGRALEWLELVNRELGRGGTYRGVMSAFEESDHAFGRKELTRRAWYGLFARELGEGKWWQVAYDLDVSGVSVDDFEFDGAMYGATAQRRPADATECASGEHDATAGRRSARAPRRHYEAWLDYVYYSSAGLKLVGYQESLSEEQARLIYQEGDALPNAWHPSDHLPVGCVFEWA